MVHQFNRRILVIGHSYMGRLWVIQEQQPLHWEEKVKRLECWVSLYCSVLCHLNLQFILGKVLNFLFYNWQMNCCVFTQSAACQVFSLTEPYLFSQVKNGIIQSKMNITAWQTRMRYSCLTNAATFPLQQLLEAVKRNMKQIRLLSVAFLSFRNGFWGLNRYFYLSDFHREHYQIII